MGADVTVMLTKFRVDFSFESKKEVKKFSYSTNLAFLSDHVEAYSDPALAS